MGEVDVMRVNSINNAIETESKISYEDFLTQYEGKWAEWVDGDVIMVPAASAQHQDIGSFLESLLRLYVEFHNLGKIFRAPFQMKLGPDLPGREPDILYIASSHLDRLKDTYLDGPADMAIEIISRESIGRDRGDKFIEYEAAGVLEYWLIDPMRQQAEFYHIGTDNLYDLILPDEEGIYRSKTLTGLWIRVSWLWQKSLPSVVEVLRELKVL